MTDATAGVHSGGCGHGGCVVWSSGVSAGIVAAFKGLGETGYVDGQNVTVHRFGAAPFLRSILVKGRRLLAALWSARDLLKAVGTTVLRDASPLGNFSYLHHPEHFVSRSYFFLLVLLTCVSASEK